MTKEHFLLHDVAKRLGVKPYQIAYALSVELVSGAGIRIPTKGFSRKRTSNGSPGTSASICKASLAGSFCCIRRDPTMNDPMPTTALTLRTDSPVLAPDSHLLS